MTDARPWTYAALFGSLWAAAEVTLGTLLKLAQVPLFGLIMASIAAACLITARRLQPVPGVCLLMGAIAASLKLCSLGVLAVGPVIGIVAEAMLIEIAMTLGAGTLAAAVAGGALALASAPVQQFLWVTLITGPRGVAAMSAGFGAAAAPLGFGDQPLEVLVAGVATLAAAWGAFVGVASWRVAGRVRRRVRGTA